MRIHVRTIVALAAGIVAAVGVFSATATVEPTVSVVTAAMDIPARTRIDHHAVKVARLPMSAAHPQALTPDQLDVELVARSQVFAGEQVLTRHVVSGAGGPIGACLPPDRVAFLLPGGWDVVVGGAAEPGDHVDIISVIDDRRQGTTAARTVLRGVLILDVRYEGGRRWTVGGRPEQPLGIVLQLSPREAELLALAITSGRLFAVLSIPGGDAQGLTGVSLDEIQDFRDE